MRALVWVLVAALIVLHQDCWNWDNGTLLAGFLPVGLAYHAVISIAATVVWLLAVQFAWPTKLEETTGSESSVNDAGGPA